MSSQSSASTAPSDAELLRESLEVDEQQSTTFTADLLTARLAYATTPSSDARFTYATHLIKSSNKLDHQNAVFHLLELLAADPLNGSYIFHLALAQFKLGEFLKAKVTLDSFDKLPAPVERDAAVESVERKAKALRRECERALTHQRLVGAALVGGSLLTAGLGAALIAGFVAAKVLKR